MLFIKQATSVRTPALYAMFMNAEKTKTYLVMERIYGHELGSEWGGLSNDDKEDITSTLKEYFHELRTLPSPGGYCSIVKQFLNHFLLVSYT